MRGTLDKSVGEPVAIRVLGVISLIFASGLLLLGLLNVRPWLVYAGPKWWPPLLMAACYWGVLGLGMVNYKRWSASIFVISASGIGLWMVEGAILLSIKTGNLWVLANVPFGLALCLPIIPTIASWRQLR